MGYENKDSTKRDRTPPPPPERPGPGSSTGASGAEETPLVMDGQIPGNKRLRSPLVARKLPLDGSDGEVAANSFASDRPWAVSGEAEAAALWKKMQVGFVLFWCLLCLYEPCPFSNISHDQVSAEELGTLQRALYERQTSPALVALVTFGIRTTPYQEPSLLLAAVREKLNSHTELWNELRR